MTRYSVQARGRIFSKGSRFLSFARNMGKISFKIWEETYTLNTVKNLWINLNNILEMHLKLLHKGQFKKPQK